MQHAEYGAALVARDVRHRARTAGVALGGDEELLAWRRYFYLFMLFAVLSLGVIANVMAAGPQRELKPFPAVALDRQLSGEDAVRGLGGRLPEVAAWYGMSPQAFARTLRQDRLARLDRQGRLFFVEEFPAAPEQGATSTATGNTSTGVTAPLDQTFRLHSRPGASRVIYLDFDGHVATNTAWNNSYGMATIDGVAFDLDGSPGTFSSVELERIQYIWKRVAEDYAPFDVDVTTEEPAADAIARSSTTDLQFGTRVVIARDWTELTASPCGCGGFAYVGAFDDTSESYKPAWVFYNRLGGGNEKYVAEAISHEAGHNLGLSHDGYNDGATSAGYYSGHGTGATGWAPIMGVGYYKELTQWSKGEYLYATQTQDDLLVIQNFGGPLRTDDHGNTIATATPLAVAGNGSTLTLAGDGTIGSRADVDVFGFYSGAGGLTLNVVPGQRGANLDLSVSLMDASGNVLAVSNPADALNASISATVTSPGTFYLVIDGTGKGDASTGYSDYASLGEYSISGTVPAASSAAPVAVATASVTSGQASLAVNFTGSGSYDPDGGTISHAWDFGDGTPGSTTANPSHTYTQAGHYLATLTVTDASGLSDSRQIAIDVTSPPPQALPSVHVEGIVMSLSITRSKARATAKVTVLDANGKPVGGVSVGGTWSGAVSGTSTGTTSSKGVVSLSSPSTNASGTFTFSITGLAVSGYSYDASLNKETTDSISR